MQNRTILVVPGLNSPPVASDAQFRIGMEPQARRTFAFPAADPDPGDRLRYTIADQPAEGRIVNNNDGTFLFDPAGDFDDLAAGETRKVRFRYLATDRAGETSEGSVTLAVAGPEDSSARQAATDQAGESAQEGQPAERKAQAEPQASPKQADDGDDRPAVQNGSGDRAQAKERTAEDQEPAATVDMTDSLDFVQETVTIPVGGTVLWKNPSSIAHTVTADPEKAADPAKVHLPEGAETFDSGTIEPGGEYRHTFTVPGRYKYVCLPHERAGMIGEVIVEERRKGAEAAPPDEEDETSGDRERKAQDSGNGTEAGEEAEEAGKGAGEDNQTAADGSETRRAEQARKAAQEQEFIAVDTRSASVRRGEYLFHAGGCASCHTDRENGGAPLAGGRAIPTAFGIFYASNITPDVETGLGRWSEEDFIRSMKQGIAPDGSPYYPVFPYAWYTRIYGFDLRDMWAYLRSIEPVRNRVPPHDLLFPYSRRSLVHGWRLMDFESGPAPGHPARSALWNRGSYLVNALAHCGTCHTTKTALGTYREDMFLAGSSQVPGRLPAPNITPDRETGIGGWSREDIVQLLATGETPSGGFVGGPMAEVISDTTSRLSDEDREAIAVYLQSVPAIVHRVEEHGSGDALREARK